MSTETPCSAGLHLGAGLRLDWNALDTVLLDMDGTLLDLHFDNYFWTELVPLRYAANRGLSITGARQQLLPKFASKHGTLDWYCTDYWSRELELDIAGMKYEVRERVRFLPGAEEFLSELRRCRMRTVLVTNAHQDSLRVKADRTGLRDYFDHIVCSHQYGLPKEHPGFWQRLRAGIPFQVNRSVFIDDTPSVLQAARAFGIDQLVAISQPDSTQPPRQIVGFPAVPSVAALSASLRSVAVSST
jgi:putative hydrolase of the HAD superfamily